MASEAELLALALACEKASGPDRELDGSIGMTVQTPGHYRKTPYTASLDAAMTLVPEGWPEFSLTSDAAPPWRADLGRHTDDGSYDHESDMAMGRGATAELAVCVAALRARAAAIGCRDVEGERP